MIAQLTADLLHHAHHLPHLLIEAPHLIHQWIEAETERREFRALVTA